jgi:hypothetical protein
MDNELKSDILKDVDKVHDQGMQGWYAERGIPYKRGYLFLGHLEPKNPASVYHSQESMNWIFLRFNCRISPTVYYWSFFLSSRRIVLFS